MFNATRILDCTLRDGGYYTDWDFGNETVSEYIRTTNLLPVDYIEVGYRNNPSEAYMGRFGYCPVPVLKKIRETSTKKIAVMLNEKSTAAKDLNPLLKPVQGIVDMVRLAVDPKNFERAAELAGAVKDLGFEVGFNMMYMSRWMNDYPGLLPKLNRINGIADLFYMVDSYGGVTPQEVGEIASRVKESTTCPVGFHGHNNLQMGLANTLAAIEHGAGSVDATALGMGRGAGNLNMELLLTCLKNRGLEVDFNVLGEYVSDFYPLMDRYRWGTTLPYMIAGANHIPQKEVMEWVSNRAYSFNSIVRALDNQRENKEDNARYPLFGGNKAKSILIVGGGPSVAEHTDAIRDFLGNNPDMALIFVTARHAQHFIGLANPHYYILVGNEVKRMAANMKPEDYNGSCILSPYPRKMGTAVPAFAETNTYELKKMDFPLYGDSCTAIALQLASDLEAEAIYVVGYDGYKGNILSEKEMELTNENRELFRNFQSRTGKRLITLTPSLYSDLAVQSIYQYL